MSGNILEWSIWILYYVDLDPVSLCKYSPQQGISERTKNGKSFGIHKLECCTELHYNLVKIDCTSFSCKPNDTYSK